MFNLRISAVSAVLAGVLAAFASAGEAAAQDVRKITFPFSLPMTSHYGQGAQALVDHVTEHAGDRYRFDLFPSTALGSEREMVEGVQLGTIDLTITSTGPVGNFVPEVLVTDLPFLFSSYEHAHAVLDGEIGREILSAFPEKGMVALAWGENGFRHLTNSRVPVREPADMAGLKVRTMENPVHVSAFRALGALPTPMAWAELYTALQQGVVDGQENPIPVILSSNLSQVQKHLTLTGHVYSPALIIMSKVLWDELPEEDRTLFEEAAAKGAAAMRAAVADADRNGVAELRRQNMDVVAEVDPAVFQERMGEVYAAYAEKYGSGMIDAIRAAAP